MSTVPRGGAATINGVLYQMLWSLFQVATLRVSDFSQDSDDAIAAATLILEPVPGGGDLQLHAGDGVVVEQVKSRGGNGTWSLKEVVESVLPDLMLASGTATVETYRFVTDGRMGQWQDVYAFLGTLRDRACPESGILDALDDTRPLEFRGRLAADGDLSEDEAYTERKLFEWIVERLRAVRSEIRAKERDQVQRRLWDLLGRFEFVPDKSAQRSQKAVDAVILQHIDHGEQLPTIRDAMLTSLARKAAKGDARINRDSFFAEHLLGSTPLSAWRQLVDKGTVLLQGEVGRRGYNATEDVRRDEHSVTLREWSPRFPTLVLEGESGQGKSWALFGLGLEITAGNGLCVFVPATANADATLQKAAQVFWQEIKGNDGVLSLSGIARRRQECVQPFAELWLTVLIDGLQDSNEARELALQPWESWGVRVAVTCTPTIAKGLIAEARNRATSVHLADFSEEQLRAYLGNSWANVPADVRDTLRRPLLASLYRTVIGQSGWQPNNEYELYERYWGRLNSGYQAEHPLDELRLGKAVQAFLDGAPYPWTTSTLNQAGFDDAALRRLCSIGWLRSTKPGHFEVWHDRLLNWAVAKRLVTAVHDRELSLDSLRDRVREFFASHAPVGGKYLGYVPMDVVWLLAQQDHTAAALEGVLAGLASSAWPLPEHLYRELLPTIGNSILPALMRRVATVAENGDPVELRLIIGAICAFTSPTIPDEACKLLSHDSRFVQRAAMRILAKRPNVAALDRLWSIHCALKTDPKPFLRDHEVWQFPQEESSKALTACAQLDPAWLEGAIQRCDPTKEPPEALAWALANFVDGRDLWLRTKAHLFRKVPQVAERCLAANIHTHRDETGIEWLLQRLNQKEHFVAGVSMRALARIAPDQAVAHLPRLPKGELYFTREWCFRELLLRRPEATRRVFLEMLRNDPDPWDLAKAYQGQANALDVPTLDFLLDELEKLLDTEIAKPPDPSRVPLYFPLEILSQASALPLIDCFARRSGGRLEARLTDWLLRIGPQRGAWRDSLEREPGLSVLHKINGTGYVQVVNAWLRADDRYGRRDGIFAARKRADHRTIELLVEIVQSGELWEGRPLEQLWATETLSAHGEWGHVVQSVLRFGLQTLRRVSDTRPPEGSLDDAVLAPALNQIIDGNPSPGAVLAIGMSGRHDLLDRIYRVAADTEPDSDLMHSCVLSVLALGDRSSRAERFFSDQLARPKQRHSAAVGLLVIGTPSALGHLADTLHTKYDDWLAGNLAHREETREIAAQEVWSELQRSPRSAMADMRIAALGVLRDDQVREYLRGVACDSDRASIWVAGRCEAIRGVAQFDPETAFQAARNGLQDLHGRDRALYPALLLKLDRERAKRLLLDQVLREKAPDVIAAIRQSLEDSDLEEWVLSAMSSPDDEVRLQACRLSGSPRTISSIGKKLLDLLDDPDDDVVHAAKDALERIDRHIAAEKLMGAMRSAPDVTRRWILLDALIDLAAPGNENRDLLGWIRHIAEYLIPSMRHYLEDEIRNHPRKERKANER